MVPAAILLFCLAVALGLYLVVLGVRRRRGFRTPAADARRRTAVAAGLFQCAAGFAFLSMKNGQSTLPSCLRISSSLKSA